MKRHPWHLIGALMLVNCLAVSGSLLALHGRLPQLTAGEASLTGSEHPVGAVKLASHYTGVAVTEPAQPRIATFTKILGRPPGLVEYYTAFGNKFPAYQAAAYAAHGSLSLIQINPRHTSLAAIAAGQYDAYLRGYAAAVRKFHDPVAIGFGHEMNGWWYPWGLPKTTPAAFIGAWRHIHQVFAAAGARNVSWVWTVSRDADRRSWPAARAWWPGPQYVNWVAIDGYFRKPGQTFSYVFARQLAEVRSFAAKPVLVGETAAAPGPQQASQIASLVQGVRQNRLLGFAWFDINALERWNIDRDPAAVTALHRALVPEVSGNIPKKQMKRG